MFSEKVLSLLTEIDNNPQLRVEFLHHLDALTNNYCDERIERVRQNRPHSKMYATMFTRPCVRQSAFSFHKVPEDNPASGRFKINMWGGQQYEHIILAALLTLSYDMQIQPYNYVWGWTYQDNGTKKHPSVVADGLITLTPEQADEFQAEFGILPKNNRIIIEIKSAGEKSYEIMRDEGLQNGYGDQAQLEMAANDTDVTVFIIVCRSKGHMHDDIVQAEPHDYMRLTELFEQIRDSETPYDVPVDQVAEPEMEYKAGKKAWDGPEDKFHVARHNAAKGFIYGWDIHTGRYKIPSWPCGYCGHQSTCWDNAGYDLELDITSGRPVWVVKPKETF